MLANSIRRALPPTCTRALGQTARSGNKARAVPRAVAATSITAATGWPIRRWAGTTPTRTAAAPNDQTSSSTGEVGEAPKWTGAGVFGVALAGGLLGWGVASLKDARAEKGTWRLDSGNQFPRYASMKEMEIVSPSFLLNGLYFAIQASDKYN